MKVQTPLIELDDLIKLVNLVILTGKVKNGRSVSVLLISDPETGKTQILELFMNLEPILWANDLSGKVLATDVARKVEEGKTHIIIPDLLKVLGHQKIVVRHTMTMLNAIMEEGLKAVLFYGTQIEFKQPVRCGVIAAITKDAFAARERHWKSIGFVSRCLLVSFKYSPDTVRKVHEHIKDGFPLKTMQIITGKPTKVDIPREIAEKTKDLVLARTPFGTGFRLHKQLRLLLQAHALYSGRSKVIMADFEEVRRLSKFMNLKFHEV